MSTKKEYVSPSIKVVYIDLEHSLAAGSNAVMPVNSGGFITDEYEQQEEDFDLIW